MANPRGNPKNLTAPRWKPGQSGNPGGRKRVVSNTYEWALEEAVPVPLRETLEKAGFKLPKDAKMKHAIALGQVRLAVTEATSAQEVRRAIEGRETARIELTGADGEAIQLEDVHDRLVDKLLK